MNPLLSICVPTYNRERFLRELLDSILPQNCDEIEIVISDNASTDNTQLMVESYQEKYTNIFYYRSPENKGFDRNLLKVVECAHGDFCWLMGSDDLVEAGAIAHVLTHIKSRPNATGWSVNSWECNYDGSEKRFRIFGRAQITHQPFTGDLCFERGSEAFRELSDYIGCISVHIVNRKLWNDTPKIEAYKHYQDYVHVYILSKILNQHGAWGYIHQRCMIFRMAPDALLVQGYYFYRLYIQLYVWEKIIKEIWHKYPDVQYDVTILNMRIQVMNIIGFAYLKTPLSNRLEPWYFTKVFLLCLKYYWKEPFFWLRIAPLCVFPRFLYFFLRNIWRSLKRKRAKETLI